MKTLINEFSEYLRIEKRYSTHTVSGYCRDLDRFSNFSSGNNKSLCLPIIRLGIIERCIWERAGLPVLPGSSANVRIDRRPASGRPADRAPGSDPQEEV